MHGLEDGLLLAKVSVERKMISSEATDDRR